MVENQSTDKRKVAWGITGSGDKLEETIEVMKGIMRKYQEKMDVRIYLSKAGVKVLKYYGLIDDLEKNFGKLHVEKDSNTPFLAGALQMRKFEFLLIAPATSNTVAKVSLGIADSLLSNSTIMALKASVPVYVMPSDCREGIATTKLPDGQHLALAIRKEDKYNTKKLSCIDGVFILEKPEDLCQIFIKYFGSQED